MHINSAMAGADNGLAGRAWQWAGRVKRTASILVRGVASLALIAGIAPAWHITQAAYFSRVAPLKAYERYPLAAVAAAAAFRVHLARDSRFAPGDADLANAQVAFVGNPLSPALLVLRGADAARQGDQAGEDRAMLAANRLSRRDPVSQLWMIEKAVQADDIPAAVRHFNAAMLVHPPLRDRLIRVLVDALAYGEVRSAVRPYLAARVDWAPMLVSDAGDRLPAPDLADLILPVASRLSEPQFESAMAKLLGSLAGGGRPDLTLALASTLGLNLAPGDIRSLAFDTRMTDPRLGKFAWSLQQSAGIASWIHEGGQLQAQVGSMAQGELASRSIVVEPGRRYHFAQTVEFGVTAAPPALRWSARCGRRDGQEVWNAAVPITAGQARAEWTVAVPHGCPILRLAAYVSGNEGMLPATFTIHPLEWQPR